MSPSFPNTRMRRTRQHPWLRQLVQETRLSPEDLVWPVFVCEGEKTRQAVDSMPGVERLSVDVLVEESKQARDLGIPAVALFPLVDGAQKTEDAKEAYNPKNLACRATRALKDAVSNLGVICDVALDPYTSHGQDGLVRDGVILNDETVEVLVKQSLTLADAGCDVVAPSDMMDGRIGAIRRGLDEQHHDGVCILSYAAKYASAFYGPFRDAVGSAGNLKGGSKATYQMAPSNTDEALREVALDVDEGADMVMVKPALPYLDVIYRVKTTFGMPTFAYHVSGEYAMLKAAGQNQWLDAEATMIESLLAIKRAGADAILTYAACDLAQKL